MNSYLQASLLGLVQGLTEFLPVSSSGHLVIFQHLFGMKKPEILFDVILHLGTLMATVVYFRKDLVLIGKESWQASREMLQPSSGAKLFSRYSQFKWLVLILFSTLVTGMVGVPLKDFFESLFSSIQAVAGMLFLTGALLWTSGLVVKRWGPFTKSMGWIEAAVIGVGQALALAPGLSRSGTTISLALLSRIRQEEAVRFSLLISIPAVCAAFVLKAKDISLMGVPWAAAAIGFVAAFVSGYIALRILIRVVLSNFFPKFSYYCWALALMLLIFAK